MAVWQRAGLTTRRVFSKAILITTFCRLVEESRSASGSADGWAHGQSYLAAPTSAERHAVQRIFDAVGK